MTDGLKEGDVEGSGERRLKAWIGLGFVIALAALALVFVWSTGSEARQDLCITTGSPGGTYLPLGHGIATVVNQAIPDRVAIEAVESSGSTENLERLDSGECQLAIIQNDTLAGPGVRAIAPLYPEVLHTVVRVDAGITEVEHLRGQRVAAGPAGSGTQRLVHEMLAHFGLGDVAEGLLDMSTLEEVEAFERGELDAVFVLSGFRSPAVERLLATGQARLLSLGAPQAVGSALEGLRVTFPFLDASVIPVRTYGSHPTQAVGTVAVQALLVVPASLDADLVRDVSAALYQSRVALMEHHQAAAYLTEQFDPSSLQVPLHAGAEAYLRRDTPPFYIRYAEGLRLFVTVLIASISGSLALRRWFALTKKNRIDVYYLAISNVTTRLESGELDPATAREKLLEIRANAFAELVDERLKADQSFTIFQMFLSGELTKLEAQLKAQQVNS